MGPLWLSCTFLTVKFKCAHKPHHCPPHPSRRRWFIRVVILLLAFHQCPFNLHLGFFYFCLIPAAVNAVRDGGVWGPSGRGSGTGAAMRWSGGCWWLGPEGSAGEEEPNFPAPSTSLHCQAGAGRMWTQCKENLPGEHWDFSSGGSRELILCASLSTFISLTPALCAAALSVFLAGR